LTVTLTVFDQKQRNASNMTLLVKLAYQGRFNIPGLETLKRRPFGAIRRRHPPVALEA
jgi:hypothetical protein